MKEIISNMSLELRVKEEVWDNDHEVERELVTIPKVQQPPSLVFSNHALVKTEIEPVDVKEEADCSNEAVRGNSSRVCSVSEATARDCLYAGHAAENELVLGPQHLELNTEKNVITSVEINANNANIEGQPKGRPLVEQIVEMERGENLSPVGQRGHPFAAVPSGSQTPDVKIPMGGLSLAEEERIRRLPIPVYPVDKKWAKKMRRKEKKLLLRMGMENTGEEADKGLERRGLKMKRQSTCEGVSERPRPKRLDRGKMTAGPRSVAKAHRDLAVAIYREDGVLVDEAMAKLIRARLTEMILEQVKRIRTGETEERAPQFAASGLVSEGLFLVTPVSTESRGWLLNQEFGVLDGVRILSRGMDQTRVQVWIPGDDVVEGYQECLRIQNWDKPELRLDEWSLIGKERLVAGTRICFAVPKEVDEGWGEETSKDLFFSSTIVKARILRPAKENMEERAVSAPSKIEPGPKDEDEASASIHSDEE